MAGHVWLGKLPADDPRRTTPLRSVEGAEVQDSHERFFWSPAASSAVADQCFNDLDDATRGRYGVRVPA